MGVSRRPAKELLSPESVVVGAMVFGCVLRIVLAFQMPSPYLFQDELNGPLIARWLIGSDSQGIGPGGGPLYGLLLAPLAWIFNSPGSFHTAALVLNAVLVSALAPLLFLIGTRVLRHSPYTSAAAATAGALTASTFAFSALVVPEVLLTVLAAASVIVMDRYLDFPSRWRQVEVTAIMLLAAATHDRAIVLVLAAFLTILWARLTQRVTQADSNLPLIVLPLGYVFLRLLTAAIHSQVLVEGGPSTSISEIVRFPLDNPQTALRVAVGGSFYLVAATAGLVVVGLIGVTAGLRPQQTGRATTVFVALALLGTAALSTMFVTGVSTNSPARVDAFTYGRYLEYLLPIVIVYSVQVWDAIAARTLGLLAACGVTFAAGYVATASFDEAFWIGPNAQSNASGLHWIKPFENVLDISSVWVYPLAAVLAVLVIALTFKVEETAFFTVAGLGVAAGSLFVLSWAQHLQVPPQLAFDFPRGDGQVTALPIDHIGSQHAQFLTFWSPQSTVRATFGTIPDDATAVVLPVGSLPPTDAVLVSSDPTLGLNLWELGQAR